MAHDLEKGYDPKIGDGPAVVEKFSLQTVENTPRFLHAPYILSGYRVYFSLRLCLRSAFKLHNETVNVWSHAIAFVYFVWLFGYTFTYELVDGDWGDKFIFFLFFLAAALCFLLSSAFHLCNCHSEITYVKLYRCDLFGITWLILCSYLPGLYYGFTCHPGHRIAYSAIITVLCTVLLVIPYVPQCKQQRFHTVRVFAFCLVIAFSIIPLVHWRGFLIRDFAEELQADLFMNRIVSMLLMYCAGFVCYATKLPERLSPGAFDIWGHSHQLWHLFVFAATVYWQQTLVAIFHHLQRTPCPVGTPGFGLH